MPSAIFKGKNLQGCKTLATLGMFPTQACVVNIPSIYWPRQSSLPGSCFCLIIIFPHYP